METLLNEFASLLHVSADSVSKIAESYPALRQQYIIYSIMQNLMGLTIFTGILAIVFTFLTVTSASDYKELVGRELENAKWRISLWLKVAVGFTLFTIVVYVVASTVSAIYAPDVNLIRDIITNVKAN